MRVLITGGLGFIGSHTAETLLAAGHHVIIVDDLSANVVEDVPGAEVHTGAHWRLGLGNAETHGLFRSFAGLDVVIHAAAPVGAVGVLRHRGHIIEQMVGATAEAIRIARRTGARLVNISSSEVYGQPGTYHVGDDLCVRAGYTARREYAVGKMACEHMLMGAVPGVPSVSIRPFNVVGPRQTSAKGFVLPTFCEQAVAGERLTVYRPGDQRRALTAVWDVADFIAGPLLTSSTVRWEGEPYNLGNRANATTVLDLARRVLRLAGLPDDHIIMTSGAEVHGAEYAEADGHTKLPGGPPPLGWLPRVPLDVLCARTLMETPGAVRV